MNDLNTKENHIRRKKGHIRNAGGRGKNFTERRKLIDGWNELNIEHNWCIDYKRNVCYTLSIGFERFGRGRWLRRRRGSPFRRRFLGTENAEFAKNKIIFGVVDYVYSLPLCIMNCLCRQECTNLDNREVCVCVWHVFSPHRIDGSNWFWKTSFPNDYDLNTYRYQGAAAVFLWM